MDVSDSLPRRRASRHERIGHLRAGQVATRLGTALRESRQAAGMSQAEVAERAGLTQTHISHLERGRGASSRIETWSMVASAAGDQLVGFLEQAPGADRPRDAEHLKRQNTLIRTAARGGWQSLPELAMDPGNTRSRSIDVALLRPATGEVVVAEIWDWFDDVGAGLRSPDAKVATVASRVAVELGPRAAPMIVRALYVVRDTRRNRLLVSDLCALFAARFPGSAFAWLAALTNPERRAPAGSGWLWSDRSGANLKPSRLNGTPGQPSTSATKDPNPQR
jgi:transcriptional regulator with XRE-family HTH domain